MARFGRGSVYFGGAGPCSGGGRALPLFGKRTPSRSEGIAASLRAGRSINEGKPARCGYRASLGKDRRNWHGRSDPDTPLLAGLLRLRRHRTPRPSGCQAVLGDCVREVPFLVHWPATRDSSVEGAHVKRCVNGIRRRPSGFSLRRRDGRRRSWRRGRRLPAAPGRRVGGSAAARSSAPSR